MEITGTSGLTLWCFLKEFQASLARSPPVHEDGKDHYFGTFSSIFPRKPTLTLTDRTVLARNDIRIPTSNAGAVQVFVAAAQGKPARPTRDRR